MATKILRSQLQMFLVDEDDAGNVIGEAALKPVVFPGVTIRDRLDEHLAAVTELCRQREQERLAQPTEGGT